MSGGQLDSWGELETAQTDRWTDLQLLNTSVQHIETVAFKLMETVRGNGLMQRQGQTGSRRSNKIKGGGDKQKADGQRRHLNSVM